MQHKPRHLISNKARAGAASLVLAMTLGSVSAHAATQGTLGATSTGSIDISASVANRARITGLSDVAFLNQDPVTAAVSAQNVCVWSNTSTRAYTITASGSGTGSAFTLANGAATVPYNVEWNASSGQTSGTALSAGTASSNLVSTATQQLCASGPSSSASLIVRISAADLATMPASTNYTGSLTLLVTPQ